MNISACHTAPGARACLLRSPGNPTLFGQWWRPIGAPRAVILLTHGAAAHSGFYTAWAEHLLAHGYAVFGYDLRGWGQSPGKGRRAYVNTIHEYVDDLTRAYLEVRAAYPASPVFLQGESLGGAVSLLAGIRNELDIAGLILNAPPVTVNFARIMGVPDWVATLGHRALGAIARLAPNLPAIPTRLLLQRAGHIVAFDEALRHKATNDPHFTHTALAAAFLTTVSDLGAHIRAGLPQLQHPFIVLHGSKDYLVPTTASELLMAKAGSRDKTRKLYEGMSHCTLHDHDKEKVWADIMAWLDTRLPASAVVRIQ